MNIDDIIENAQLKGRVIGLEAQVETLTAEVRCLEAVVRSHERVDCLSVANLKAEVARLNSLIANSEHENARLKAEVERLTKAGDNLVYVVSEHPVSEPFVKAWFAAKEGKQS